MQAINSFSIHVTAMKKKENRYCRKCNNPSHPNAKPDLAASYWDLYKQGFSLSKIAEIYGVHRNSVHHLLKSHGFDLRKQKRLTFIVFNGAKYTISGQYYKRTDGRRSLLHRDIWECYQGKIPPKWDVHHINGDKSDNRIENLECLPKKEHTKHHRNGRNTQFKCKPVRRLDTGEVYPSLKSAALELNISSASIGAAISRKGTCAGIRWEFV